MSLLRFKTRLIAAASVVGGGFYNSKDSTSEGADQICCSKRLSKKKLANCKTRCLKMLERARIANGIPGYTATITYNGQTVLSLGGGYADVENDVPCSNETVMRIASISKPLTSVALLQLWEKSKVELDAPIQQYVPKFPKKTFKGKPVTITTRQLLSHMGGVRHYKITGTDADDLINNQKEMFTKKHFKSMEESLELFWNDDLINEPGTAYHYTTYGWTLIGAVIEAASGMEYLQYMKYGVLRPLQMTSTGPEYHSPLVYNRARYYCRNMKKGLRNSPYIDVSCKWAGGGFVSTSDDLVKFGNALLLSYNQWQRQEQLKNVKTQETSASQASENKSAGGNTTTVEQESTQTDSRYILHPATVAMMWRPVVTVNEEALEGASGRISYGMGWCVQQEESSVMGGRQKQLTVSHTGGSVGASSVLTIIPGSPGSDRHRPEGVVVALLFNQQDFTTVYSLGKRLAEEVYWSLVKDEKREEN